MNARFILEGERKRIVALIVGENRCPADDFIQNELDENEFKKTMGLLRVMADRGEIRDRGKSKPITDYDGLFEFIPTDQIRLLWCHMRGNIVVLLDGFRKKTMKGLRVRSKYQSAGLLAEQVRKNR